MQVAVCLIPLGMCWFATVYNVWWLHLGAVCTLVAVVGVLPAARSLESVFVFVLTAVSLIPLNASVLNTIIIRDIFDNYHKLAQVCWTVILYITLLNIEEIVLGFVVRFIWPKQKGIFSD